MESIRELYKIGKGPSSSHTIGPERAAKRFLEKYPDAEKYQVRLYGSLSIFSSMTRHRAEYWGWLDTRRRPI